MTALRRLVGAGLAAVALAACGGGGDDASAPGPPTTSGTTATPGPSAGGPTTAPAAGATKVPDVLQFRATGVDGQPVVGTDYAGRDVALWFWAPW